MRAELDALRARVTALEAARQEPGDPADARLLLAISAHFAGRAFSSADVLFVSQSQPDLAAALEGADVCSRRELGKLQRRLHQRPIDGYVVTRVRDRRMGTRWAVSLRELRECSPETRAPIS